jgi:cytochrome c55X
MARIRLILLPLLLSMTGLSLASAAEPTPGRQAELIHLLRHDCGSCHGMRLQGGLGPPLTPDRLERLSSEQLSATILHGRPGTPMPPWRPFLTHEEALWLARQLKRGVAR